MKWFQLSVMCSLGCAAIFSVISLALYYGDWKRLMLVASIGAFVGLLAAPEFDRRAFKKPALFQVASGAVAGTFFGISFLSGNQEIIIASIAGAFIGWLTPYWIKHVPIP